MSKHTPQPASSRAASVEREQLRAAIVRKNDIEARISKIEAALNAETQRKYAASAAVDDAESVLLKAKESEPQDNIARVLGEEPTSLISVFDAQRALEQAQAEYQAKRMLCEGLSERIESEQSSLRYVDSAIDDAIREVISASPEGQGLVADYCAKLDAFNLADKTLQAISTLLTRDLHAKAISHHTDASYNYQRLAPDERWPAAIEALKQDADAVLPA